MSANRVQDFITDILSDFYRADFKPVPLRHNGKERYPNILSRDTYSIVYDKEHEGVRISVYLEGIDALKHYYLIKSERKITVYTKLQVSGDKYLDFKDRRDYELFRTLANSFIETLCGHADEHKFNKAKFCKLYESMTGHALTDKQFYELMWQCDAINAHLCIRAKDNSIDALKIASNELTSMFKTVNREYLTWLKPCFTKDAAVAEFRASGTLAGGLFMALHRGLINFLEAQGCLYVE